MAQEPTNPKLWAMLTAQARAKFRIYPSPAASHWVHHEYEQKGGRFSETSRRSAARKTGHGRGRERDDDADDKGRK